MQFGQVYNAFSTFDGWLSFEEALVERLPEDMNSDLADLMNLLSF